MKKRTSGNILGAILACLIIASMFGGLPNAANAANFGIGDTVEVYNTGSSGLLVRDAPCGNIIGGKFDGDRGVVLDGPVFCNNYNRWLIRWNGGLEGWSAEDWLRRVSQPPPPPAHISPLNGATGVSLTPTFKWSSVPGADYYGLYISEPPYGPSNLVYDSEVDYGSISGTSLPLPSGILSSGVKYYWNMRSHNAAGWGTFSSSWYFTTTPPLDNIPTVSITSPSNNQHFSYSTSAVPVQGTANDDHQVTLVQVRVNSGSWTTASGTTSWSKSINLKVGANRIEAKAKDNNNQYSAIASITVYREEQKPPPPPTPSSPGSSSSPVPTIDTLTPAFRWSGVSGADYYGLYIRDLDTNTLVFDSQVRGIQITGTPYTLPSGVLEWGKPYRWNMNSHNSAGWGSYSGVLYFQTRKVTPCPHSCWDRDPLSNDELGNLVRRNFPLGGVTQTGESIRVTAYAIAKAESGGNPSACGDNDKSIGLWQINIDYHPKYDKCRLFEEDYNANAAKEISNNGKDWNPWCTWEKTACGGKGNERYKQYLTEARKHFYPEVTSLSVSQTSINLGEAVKIYYCVLDDVGLDRVELWRTTDKNGSPDASNWKEVKKVSISGTPYSDHFNHSPDSSGVYWYGIHVIDNSGAPEAWNDERNSRTGGLPGVFGPIQVEVIPKTYLPQVTTEGASSITTSSATLTGNLDSTGGLYCQRWFEYGTTISYGSSTSKLSISSTGPFSAIISGLNDDKTYHFRAAAKNSKGTRYGSDMTFKTEREAYPNPTISVAGNKTEIDVGETDWVEFTVTNEGTEYTSEWGIQVKVGDGLELVQHSSYPWDQKMCNDKAAEWYKYDRLNAGDRASIIVGIKGKTSSNYESVWYTAWMHDPDGQPEAIQYTHNYWGNPCSRSYAEYRVKVVSPNQSPVADIDIDYAYYISSGSPIAFNASKSYDPDGTIISYEWDFGDGTVSTGSDLTILEHRFRGEMVAPEYLEPKTKTYTVKLTVRDDEGATATDTAYIDIKPLVKTIEITSTDPLSQEFAKMTAYYNWIGVTGDTGEDVYMVSAIHFEAEGFVSYLLSIWDEYSFLVGIPTWSAAVPFPPWHPVEKTFAYPFGSNRDQTYAFDDGYFEGMAVGPSDKMRLWAFNIEEVEMYFFPTWEGVSACFAPDSTEELVPSEPASYPTSSVGKGAPNPQLFIDCYDRDGGVSTLGDPVNEVHRWGNGYIQDFRGGQGYAGAIMQPDGTNSAYAVYGSIWSRYLTLGGAEGPLRYPMNDESPLPSSSISGAECKYNRFYGGSIVHHATGSKAGLTVFLGHGIFDKWEESNFGDGILGLPTSDERDAQSGAEGFDTTGAVSDFEGGHIHWHRTGSYADQAFETYGAIDSVYMQTSGTAGWLGFPVTDEYNPSGYPQSDFEGGYITTTDGLNYEAFRYDTEAPGVEDILAVLDDHFKSRPSDLLGGKVPTVDDIFNLLDAYFSS